MLSIHVYVHVTRDAVEDFRAATIQNARLSRTEPGVVRFDMFQQADDPTRFELVEVYRTADAVAAHKETPHYQTWRDAVAGMMAEPRRSTKCLTVFPADTDW
ncbi:MAG: putative quinol monooxygenase [Vicinamibacterales bacterium]